MESRLQEMIAAKNREAGLKRQKTFAKKQYLVNSDRQAMELVLQRFAEYDAAKDPASLRELRQAMTIMKRRLEPSH